MSTLDPNARLKDAVTDFMFNMLDKPVTARRLSRYYAKWRKRHGVEFEKVLAMRIRLLLSMENTPRQNLRLR